MNLPINILASAAPSGDLLGMLGIDWVSLAINIIAFLILMWFLGRFVYPPLSRSLDKREADIEAAATAAAETREAAERTQAEVDKLLGKARRDAADILATAKTEATEMLARSDRKAREQAEALVTAARSDIERELVTARKTLYNDALDLVVAATARVTSQTVDVKSDSQLVAKSLEEAR